MIDLISKIDIKNHHFIDKDNNEFYIYQHYDGFSFDFSPFSPHETDRRDRRDRDVLNYILIGDIHKKCTDDTKKYKHNKIICYINDTYNKSSSSSCEYVNGNSNDGNSTTNTVDYNKNKKYIYDSIYITEISIDVHKKSWIHKKLDKHIARDFIKKALIYFPTEETLENKIIHLEVNKNDLDSMYNIKTEHRTSSHSVGDNISFILQYGESYINRYIEEIKHKIEVRKKIMAVL
jgi:hypothetical protein